MNVFDVRDAVIDDYRSFTSAFVDPLDKRIRYFVDRRLEEGSQWPDPWLSLNPNFAPGGSTPELVADGLLHPECDRIFRIKPEHDDFGRPLQFHRHQRDAIAVARSGKSYVLTTGTGSGKSLSYIVPIVDRVLRERDATGEPAQRGVKAIIVYPMNALANSQMLELEKFLKHGYPEGGEPVTFARYTGQENPERRQEILSQPPDILLTNYVMLDLVLTRPDERQRLVRAAAGLRFLVLDELHTYRGRQGADVAMLIRRVRQACQSPDLQVVGTSATMASTGTLSQRRDVVASVATRLFGSEVTADRVIGETLVRATSAEHPGQAVLASAVGHWATDPPNGATYETLRSDPLAGWIESTFGLATDPVEGVLVRQVPATVSSAAVQLSNASGADRGDCEAAIRSILLAGSRAMSADGHRPLFAFRLHQFVSKGDTVYASLESEGVRRLTDTYQLRVPGEPDKALLPLGFCRECGQDYYIVAKVNAKGRTKFVPRHDTDASGGDATTGYIYISTDHPWPADPVANGRLPDQWLVDDDLGGSTVLPTKVKYLPERVFLRPDGTETSSSVDGMTAWFMSTPFAFCLRCRVSYEQVRGNDFSKLATLDQEGRSSAMTIISSSVVRALKQVPADELGADARKLLTFVDNRQDAALQAGHFNDFVQVAQLRGALSAALAQHPRGLSHESVAQLVTSAMHLGMADFAANPGARFSAKDEAERALREVVEYRLYADLKRGWRVTMPNLEQVGLLKVGYRDVAEIAGAQDLWDYAHASLASAEPKLREELCRILLDEMRRVLAIDVECLTEQGFERVQRMARQHLVDSWQPPDGRGEAVGVMVPSSGSRGGARTDLNVSGRSAVGRYLRSPAALGRDLSMDDAQAVIHQITGVLAENAVLRKLDDGPVATGRFRVRASHVMWLAGDGTKGADDPLRRHTDADAVARVNPFFLDLYRNVAVQLSGLHAKEHTAQVSPMEREARETAFRQGDQLKLLYCSPTMELGVDISSLNAVAMRNVPPTPANYAQRSGRAGRSGQPALVLTYCATGNSHDSYWFRRSRQMVAGSVQAPRLDLTNEELIRSHVHAIWLAETGQSMKASLIDICEDDGDVPQLKVRDMIWAALIDADAQYRAISQAADVLGELRRTWNATGEQPEWWDDEWVARTVKRAPLALEQALERWRTLYRNAKAEYTEQARLAIDPNVPSKRRETATAREREARERLKILRNEDSEIGQTDFYSYRYLASEGFLPGYSFPRLPLAAYIPGGRARERSRDGDFLQRPRFLAISEFGPGALIYHEGARYEVHRIQLPRSSEAGAGLETEVAVRCESCGYHHTPRAGDGVCEGCRAKLTAKTYGLLRLQSVHTRRRERISSDEEERRRSGFELEVSYAFAMHGDRPSRVIAVVKDTTGEAIAEVVYGDAATIRIANVGRRRRKDSSERGFLLDTVGGRWLSETKSRNTPEENSLDVAEDADRPRRVIPYVEDTRNIAIVRWSKPVDETAAATLRYALERGIEAAFQLEDSELTTQRLPDLDDRCRFLLIESAEGGAGVLHRLVTEPGALARAAREALEISHFDPATGVDLAGEMPEDRRCQSGCYDCLLAYSNQLDHSLIDRHSARDLLVDLAGSTCETGSGGQSRATAAPLLVDAAESGLEHDFVGWLEQRGYRLPDRAQVIDSGARARPDLVYDLPEGRVAVFVDGPFHDDPHQAERDAAAEDRLLDAGWLEALRVRYDDDWAVVVARYPSVFGTGRTDP